MITEKKLSMVIAGAALSAFCWGLEAAHAYPEHSHSEPHAEGRQDVLVVPPDAPGRPVYSVYTGLSTFLATREDTGGQFSLFDLTVSPQTGPPTHIHNDQDEAFYVLEGEFALTQGNQTTVATPGTFAYIPRGRRHQFQNLGTEPARLLALTTPSGFEGFFAEEGQPLIDRSNPPPPRQNLAEIAPIAQRYDTQLALSPEPADIAPGLRDFILLPPGAPSRESVSIAGGLYTSLATGEETGGQFSLFDVLLPPETESGLLQSNDRETQSFYVFNGEVTIQLEHQSLVATPGTFVSLPEGTPYALQNLGTTEARTLSLSTPTSVPEPSSWLGVLGFGACVGANLVLKRKQQKQKSVRRSLSTTGL